MYVSIKINANGLILAMTVPKSLEGKILWSLN